jgi:hypothetical protein
MTVFERLARPGTAKDSRDIVEIGGLDEGGDDRRTPVLRRRNQRKNRCRRARLAEWRAPGGIVVHFDFEAAIAGKARQAARQAFFSLKFFRRGFLHAPQIRAKPGMPAGRDDDGRTTPPPPPRPRPPDRNSKPAPASARPPRCSCGGRNVTVRLWWVGTPIPACRAALVARQARILSSLRQPDKRFPRVPKLLFPFSTSLVKPASTRGPDFEREIATLDEHWQERTIALMLRHTKAGDIGAPDNKHSRTPRGTQNLIENLI